MILIIINIRRLLLLYSCICIRARDFGDFSGRRALPSVKVPRERFWWKRVVSRAEKEAVDTSVIICILYYDGGHGLDGVMF